MDINGSPGGMIPGMASGMLGLEMPLHQQQQRHHQMVSFATQDNEHHSQSQQVVGKQQAYPYNNKSKQQQQQTTWSDEDEPGVAGEDGGGDGKKKTSPWHRMKWTDNMVRLLIMVVFYIGDDVGGEATDPSNAGKKKSGGLLQKKGKWKSVSKAMMEKGFYVSPQQCEDKFNDLNKRYKRVNDIIGKGTACKVVENQSLLDTMDNLTPKMKEEVRKLLNSKHLFFREMCAYHSTCGGGGGGGGGASASAACTAPVHQSPAEVSVDSSHHPSHQRCLHSSENDAVLAGSRIRADAEGLKVGRGDSGDEEDGNDDDDDDDEDDDDEEEEEMENSRGHKSHNGYRGGGGEEEEELGSKKRQRREMLMLSSSTSPPSSSPALLSAAMQQLNSELINVLQDGTKSKWEQRQWVKSKALQLEEQRINYQYEAFELEKQRLKWIKFSGKKEREMERMKLENDRMKLENERMVLVLRQKELELLDLQQQQQQPPQQLQQQLSSNRRPDPSSITG